MSTKVSDARAAYWAKMGFWTIEQATALLIGKDPDVILDAGGAPTGCSAETLAAYRDTYRLIDSYARISGKGFNQPPADFIEWASHIGIDPAPGLVEAVQAQGRKSVEARTTARSKAGSSAAENANRISERERNTLLRIIIGMAVRGYGYDPDAARSDIPKTIADDLSGLGLECSDQTVREKLKEARTFLPGDWKARGDGKAN